MESKTSASQGCDTSAQCASAEDPAADSSSIPAGTLVTAAAGAGAGHKVAVPCGSHGSNPRSSSSSSHGSSAAAAPELVPAPASRLAAAFKRYGLPDMFPPGIAAICAEYLSDVQYNRLQREYLLPKREAGMIVLAPDAFNTFPGDCEYISSTADQPGFQMPSNRKAFSFSARDVTVPAILRLLSPSVPWNITMLTIVLSRATGTRCLDPIFAILSDIATALGHVKHLVLIIDSIPYVFNMGKYDGELLISEIGVNNAMGIRSILTTCLQYTGGWMPEYVLANFPNSESLSNGLHSIRMSLVVTSKVHLAFLQKLVDDPKNPFDNRLKIAVELDWRFMFGGEHMRFAPYFSYVVAQISTRNQDAILLDFSKFERMVSLNLLAKSANIGSIVWPTNTSNLEKINLHIIQHGSELTFPSPSPYPRVREIRLFGVPANGLTMRLDSNVFPALEKVICHVCGDGATLDFSGIKKPGFMLELDEEVPFRAAFILPTVALGQLFIDGSSLSRDEIAAALPRVHDLRFIGSNFEHIPVLFEMIGRAVPATGASVAAGADAGAGIVTRGVASDSAAAAEEASVVRAATSGAGGGAKKCAEPLLTFDVLERLVLCSELHLSIRMDIFPRLQTLELGSLSTALDGDNFPQLVSLILQRGDARITGKFSSLISMKLKELSPCTVVHCTAPVLHELECTGMSGASNVVIGPLTFPLLQSLDITVLRTSHADATAAAAMPLPTISPGASLAWSSAITVRLGLPFRLSSSLHELIGNTQRKLPECLIITGVF